MPTLLFDAARHLPKMLGANAPIHAAVQKEYAARVLGYPVWVFR